MLSILIVAHEAALRPSRDKSIDPAVWLEVVASILGAIVDQYDMSVGEDWWSKATALALEPSPKKARVERVSSSFKEALADQVSKDCRLKKHLFMVGVQRCAEGGQRRSHSEL